MLSKVLTGEAGLRAEPFYTQTGVRSEVKPFRAEPAQTAPVEDRSAEIAELQRRIHDLTQRAAQAEREAFAKGQHQGAAQAHAELQPVLERLNTSISETIHLRSTLRQATEADLVRLALAIAKRILHRELQVDESALSALARFAFERMGRAERYRIRVHPRFAPGIEQSLPRRSSASVQIDADPGCAPGTLVVETEGGTVDASVDTQMEEITRGLADRIG